MSDNQPVILCLDDDPDILSFLQIVLEAEGYAFAGADSAEEGLRKYKEVDPDLIIVDLMMEESDSGFALCHEIKQRYPSTPIIVVTSASGLTGYDFESLTGDQRAWVQADAVLAKPIRFDQLAGQVSRLLDR